jgi:hypothetical protein
MPVEQEFFVFGADLLFADGGFAVGNPGDHLPDIYGFVVVVMRQGGYIPCVTPRKLRPGASD